MRRKGIDIDTFACEKLPSILDRIDPRWLNADGLEPGLCQLAPVFLIAQRSSDAPDPQQDLLAYFDRHIAPRDDTPAPIDWTRTALEKRDALIALDAHSNNFSHREVAVIIHGDAKVDGEWVADGCELKDYVRRCRTRGVRYMQGGYRRLLR